MVVINKQHEGYQTTPQVVETSQRLSDMLQRRQTLGLSPSETCDLERYLQLEKLLTLAKSRGHQRSTHN